MPIPNQGCYRNTTLCVIKACHPSHGEHLPALSAAPFPATAGGPTRPLRPAPGGVHRGQHCRVPRPALGPQTSVRGGGCPAASPRDAAPRLPTALPRPEAKRLLPPRRPRPPAARPGEKRTRSPGRDRILKASSRPLTHNRGSPGSFLGVTENIIRRLDQLELFCGFLRVLEVFICKTI